MLREAEQFAFGFYPDDLRIMQDFRPLLCDDLCGHPQGKFNLVQLVEHQIGQLQAFDGAARGRGEIGVEDRSDVDLEPFFGRVHVHIVNRIFKQGTLAALDIYQRCPAE